MIRKSIVGLTCAAFLLTATHVMAKSHSCTILLITDKEVTLNCENVEDLIVDEEVRLKVKSKPNKGIEGC